jgi:hypothetical protein
MSPLILAYGIEGESTAVNERVPFKRFPERIKNLVESPKKR